MKILNKTITVYKHFLIFDGDVSSLVIVLLKNCFSFIYKPI